ncbi:hypothetical protein C5167_005484 [Papaver somniferum]|uniref:H15 domain-containing protein n=1 Tax=Papaver somniferum TaxID=3469 RepID=A0A4Y7JEW3_PAPSO|nr:mucin-2-like [Papaver somniferum]RZC58185.1 hypothetical protein C5167_005484 [Papaver somniferum]
MEPFFSPPPPLPHFLASQPLPTAAPPPPPQLITPDALPPQPQVVIPPSPLAFIAPSQTNLDQLHITQVQGATAAPSPPPKQTPNSHKNHPPYHEMIITAIKALNEKTGSSKKAIAKFIDSAYTNLPQSHSALLSNHLKRLKDNGVIITIKNSYALPSINNNLSSAPAPAAAAAPDNGTPSAKRGRGRPPKINTVVALPNPSPNTIPNPSPSTIPNPSPYTIPNPSPNTITTIVGGASPNTTTTIVGGASPNTTTVVVEVQDRSGEVVLPAKRGRGRPPRSIAKPKAIAKPKPKPISGGGGSRPRGRPRKLITDASASASAPPAPQLVPGMVILPTNENTINGAVPLTTVTSITAATPTGRGVGRPRKVNVEASGVAPVVNGAVVKPVSSGKPGRPKKVGSVGRPKKVGAVGRPKRSAGRPARLADAGIVKKTAAVSTGRPVGRPRKVGNNIKDKVVTLLEESLGLGMNQNVPDMYLRLTQLYTIITGRDYNLALAGATAQGNNQ